MRRSLDIIAALGLAVVAGMIGLQAYTAMLRMEGPAHIIFSGLKPNDTHFHIMNRSTCIGELSTNLTNDQGWTMRSNGRARGVYGKHLSEAELSIVASFNTLGQLTDSITEVNGPTTSIKLRSRGINPLHLAIEARVGDRAFAQEITLPGPILIDETDSEHLHIEYSGLRSTQSGIIEVIGANLLGELDLSLVDSQGSSPGCPSATHGAFDIATLMLKSRGLEMFVQRLMPDAIP